MLFLAHTMESGMSSDFDSCEGAWKWFEVLGSRFEVQAEVQNVRGSRLLRHERQATDTSVASETARRAGRARRVIGQFGLFGSSGLFGWADRESTGNHAESARKPCKAYPAFEAP
jgi:hypothetical protein